MRMPKQTEFQKILNKRRTKQHEKKAVLSKKVKIDDDDTTARPKRKDDGYGDEDHAGSDGNFEFECHQKDAFNEDEQDLMVCKFEEVDDYNSND